MKTFKVLKKQIIQHAGEFESHVYKVESGLLKSYSVDEKGKEHIFMFAPEGWVIADATEQGMPTGLYIEAIEDSELHVIDKNIALQNSDKKALSRRIEVMQKRIIMLMSSSAIERYNHFIATYPKLTQRIPQRMIASYLGITPEALSKVKSQKLKRQNS
ncbi:Crp/Fnr family transcriptional regulator [Aureibacter tunicatorum]|uniref:CRP-like cAMP-binding protein n=1 Tax=Aureibacter tunicatorum TaxID=866807 RepID=A0AAE4BV32_9BACT|nr:Crp/Fnr family transcriptional regulator [Aureibacter tunicatorum]MDR6241378.1 CRP-like cAMP-binding protein [Aureibacter tunicatorum]BDD06777.1 Crp/Fnr family transcriptional regulator [Aureibacter tunicatorum]